MYILAAAKEGVDSDQLVKALNDIKGVFNFESLLLLLGLGLVAFIIAKIIAFFLRRVSRYFRSKADASSNLPTVNRYRSLETWTILLITVFQVTVIAVAFYYWWIATHEGGGRSGALIGASAVFIVVVGGIAGPLLRDMAFGAAMLTERWFGVGDLITVEFPKAQGVVEQITLRSTKIRGLNGETIWLVNQSLQGVSVASKGVLAVAIELFVNNVDEAQEMIADVNKLLPTGSALLAQTLVISKIDQRSDNIWHITAIGETAPGREWILQRAAIDLMIKLDEKRKKPILLTDPVHRFADRETENQFVRAVQNAKKPNRKMRYRGLSKEKIEEIKKSQND